MHPPKESYSPSFGIHNLQTIPWGIGGAKGAPSIKAGNLTGLIFCRYCADYHIYCDFIHSKAMHFIAPFHIYCIYILSPSSAMFPELWRVGSCCRWSIHSWALKVIYVWYFDLLWVSILTITHCKKWLPEQNWEQLKDIGISIVLQYFKFLSWFLLWFCGCSRECCINSTDFQIL